MHILKSFFVFIWFALWIALSLWLIKKHIVLGSNKGGRVLTSIVCLLSFLGIVLGGEYLYPFDRNVKFSLFSSIEIPEEHSLSGPNEKFWHAAYEEYGIFAESFFFDPDEKVSYLGFTWPDMDFKNHTYIITYGQKLLSLTYNVWDFFYMSSYTGAKVGYAVLDENFDPNMVYVYEIKKIRIDNDP